MKRLTPLTFSLLLSTYGTYAQKPLPVADKMLRDSIGENLNRNLEQLGLLEVIRRQTKATQEEVAATQKLQEDYQTFLRQTATTAGLGISDLSTEQQAVLEAMQTGQHLSDYSFAAELHQVYQTPAEPMEKSEVLYQYLVPYDEQILFTDLATWKGYQKAWQQNILALREMSDRRKLQLAQGYRQLAQRKIEKAAELRMLLTTAERFSMTERERLEMLTQMQQALQESQALTNQADELIQHSARPSWTKAQAVKAYQHQQARKVLATTLLYDNY
jgi:hypothetical protein